MRLHRCRDAREFSGLSIGQASVLTGITTKTIGMLEADCALSLSSREIREMSIAYGVAPEWLTGESERYDFDSVDAMAGADVLTPQDRRVLAEIFAAMPTRKRHPGCQKEAP